MYVMRVRRRGVVFITYVVLAAALAFPARAATRTVAPLMFAAGLAAQGTASLTGRLIDSLSGAPLSGATVQVDELKRQTVSAQDGSFTFENLTPGVYHLSVQFAGYSTRRMEVTVSTSSGPPMDVAVDPELHFQEVTTVGPDARSQFESFQPTSVLARPGADQTARAVVGRHAGESARAGFAQLRPRPGASGDAGLDGDRVLILQDGQRMGDVSSQSGDHGVTDQSRRGAAHRGRARTGDAALRRQRHRRPGQRHHRRHPDPTRPGRERQRHRSISGSAAKEAGGAGSVQVGNGAVRVARQRRRTPVG